MPAVHHSGESVNHQLLRCQKTLDFVGGFLDDINLLSSKNMNSLIARLKTLLHLPKRTSEKQQPLSESELKQEAEKFAEKYGDVLKKLAQE